LEADKQRDLKKKRDELSAKWDTKRTVLDAKFPSKKKKKKK
jgi:hypothetical protein